MDVIPEIGLGTWKSPKTDVLVNAIKYAVEEAGYRHIDCAPVYENEAVVGTALHDLLSRGVVKREELWITSKLWCTKHRPDLVEEACRQTLKDLQLDYLDLYLMHCPCSFIVDEANTSLPLAADGHTVLMDTVPIVDTWKAMERLVEIGLVKRIGVSNFTINMLEKLRYNTSVKIQPFCNQIEMHLYMQQEPMRWYLKMRGILLQAYSPLGSNDWRKPDEPCLLEDEELVKVAAETGKTVGEVALRFLQQLGDGNIVLLPKSVTPARIKANIECNHFTLSDSQMDRLRKRERCYRFVNIRKNWNCDVLGDGW